MVLLPSFAYASATAIFPMAWEWYGKLTEIGITYCSTLFRVPNNAIGKTAAVARKAPEPQTRHWVPCHEDFRGGVIGSCPLVLSIHPWNPLSFGTVRA